MSFDTKTGTRDRWQGARDFTSGTARISR